MLPTRFNIEKRRGVGRSNQKIEGTTLTHGQQGNCKPRNRRLNIKSYLKGEDLREQVGSSRKSGLVLRLLPDFPAFEFAVRLRIPLDLQRFGNAFLFSARACSEYINILTQQVGAAGDVD